MERERFDGADIMHLLRARADLDWQRLLRRFGPHWRVLFSHLVLFGFVYPSERHRIPERVMSELIARLAGELGESGSTEQLCQGTLISRAQYLMDIEDWGYRDARLIPSGNMHDKDVSHWTGSHRKKEEVTDRLNRAYAGEPSHRCAGARIHGG